ncbi:hypothetical protein RN347_15175 [Halomonas sp. PAMB 3264]|uniref:hypothetical protein n=1 Tax=Halomonas sp. PAMB 3264 TaxID=3075222 RepID=UPI0028A0CB2B|nr:hypothetical protein [Halomonas sp. PAMB 3264]WNL41948.1 hypothetical protein RN347_15175 [Halomonas sp. PAMB 3264]
MPLSQFETVTDGKGQDLKLRLHAFAETYGLEACAPGRCSVLLLLELYAGASSGTLNPGKVIDQIKVLEGLIPSRGLKKATPFNRKELKGLWHQHYLESGLPSMAINLQKGLNIHGIPWLKQQIEGPRLGDVITAVDCHRIAHDAVVSNWGRLIEQKKLTGEWLIFAQHEGQNYYLCLGKHTTGDDVLRSRIDAVCLQEFAFLQDLLSPG